MSEVARQPASSYAELWGEKPTVASAKWLRPLVTLENLFEIMLAGVERWRLSGKRDFSIWLEGDIPARLESFVPLHEDGGIIEYYERLRATQKVEEFTFAQHGLHKYNFHFWDTCRRAVTDLVETTGVPTDGVDTDTFLGAYSSTPRGIHTDQASTFMHILHGRKRMLVWPPNYFSEENAEIVGTPLRKTVLQCDLERALADAEVLEGEVGDILYWPASYWHLSTSDRPREFSIAVNIGLFIGEADRAMLYSVTQRALQSALRPFSAHQYYDVNQAIPEVEATALARLRKLISGPVIEEEIADQWCRRLSSGGFRDPPPVLEIIPSYSEESQFRLAAEYGKVVFWKVRSRQLVVYGFGQAVSLPLSDALLAKLSELAKGGQVRASHMLALLEDASENPKEARDYLRRLLTSRILST